MIFAHNIHYNSEMESNQDILKKIKSKSYELFNNEKDISEVWKLFRKIRDADTKKEIGVAFCSKCKKIIYHFLRIKLHYNNPIIWFYGNYI